MLATIRLVLLLVAAVAATGGAGWAWNVLFDNPVVEKAATRRAEDACALRTVDAANRAEAAERRRQDSINAEAIAVWRAAADAQAQRRRAAEVTLDREIADYELKLRETGRSCVVTDDDFGWLRDQPDLPPRANGR
jgi:hypothetical protein